MCVGVELVTAVTQAETEAELVTEFTEAGDVMESPSADTNNTDITHCILYIFIKVQCCFI